MLITSIRDKIDRKNVCETERKRTTENGQRPGEKALGVQRAFLGKET